MKRKENIVSYTDKEPAAMEARGEDRTDRNAVRAKTEEQLAAEMASDPAWDGVPEDWVSRAHAAARLMQRAKENKRQVPMLNVTMRFDADALEFFKSTGRGWASSSAAGIATRIPIQGWAKPPAPARHRGRAR